MIEKELEVANRLGLHARPAAKIAQVAAKHSASVKIIVDGMEINAKSVMGIMMLAADKGTKLRFVVEGDGEQALMDEIERLFKAKFDEE